MGSVDERFLVELDRRQWLATQDALERARGGRDLRGALKAVYEAHRCPSLAELGREFGDL